MKIIELSAAIGPNQKTQLPVLQAHKKQYWKIIYNIRAPRKTRHHGI